MLGWQFARLRAKARPFQDCPVWRIPQQSTVNRSPKVVVPTIDHTVHRVGQCASAADRSSRPGSSGGHAGH
eukprot:6944872-Prymnesium_polylepis.1